MKRPTTKKGKILVNYRRRFKSTIMKRRGAALADCIITTNKVKSILKTNDEKAHDKHKFIEYKLRDQHKGVDRDNLARSTGKQYSSIITWL